MSGEDTEYKVEVNLPTLPKGEPVQIVGLGTFENGSTTSVSKNDAERYRTFHTKQVSVTDDDGNVVGSKAELGPTLLQASKNMYGVEVTTASGGSTSSSTSTTSPKPSTSTENPAPSAKAKSDSNDGGDN